MTDYIVTMKVTGTIHVYVEADSLADARDKANSWDVYMEDPICDYSDWEVVSVGEND